MVETVQQQEAQRQRAESKRSIFDWLPSFSFGNILMIAIVGFLGYTLFKGKDGENPLSGLFGEGSILEKGKAFLGFEANVEAILDEMSVEERTENLKDHADLPDELAQEIAQDATYNELKQAAREAGFDNLTNKNIFSKEMISTLLTQHPALTGRLLSNVDLTKAAEGDENKELREAVHEALTDPAILNQVLASPEAFDMLMQQASKMMDNSMTPEELAALVRQIGIDAETGKANQTLIDLLDEMLNPAAAAKESEESKPLHEVLDSDEELRTALNTLTAELTEKGWGKRTGYGEETVTVDGLMKTFDQYDIELSALDADRDGALTATEVTNQLTSQNVAAISR